MDLPREWHGGWLPPGTPAPTSRDAEVRCLDCHHRYEAIITIELGASFVEPEECPNCKSTNLEEV